jgi:hypothetical protein
MIEVCITFMMRDYVIARTEACALLTDVRRERKSKVWLEAENVGRILRLPILGGLHHQYIRI